jgi:hypothetical protein
MIRRYRFSLCEGALEDQSKHNANIVTELAVFKMEQWGKWHCGCPKKLSNIGPADNP